MARGSRITLRPWIAAVIVSTFVLLVAASAAIGWWFARESPAHQGPIVLISVDALPAVSLPAYGAQRTDTPAIDLFASDAVVFDRAYSQSPQMLPAHASLLSGQLPLQHGVRDDAGFTLGEDVQTLAEVLRNRGFATGAAVSSFLLRPETGVSQGFRFYDAALPENTADGAPVLERAAADTLDAAESWVRTQSGRRFFLFVQVDQRDADTAVTRLAALLKSRDLYDGATIVLVGDRGENHAPQLLDDDSLRVPLLVKQPGGEGAGRRVAAAVQQVDIVPTILDLVRAPVPGSVAGRSLRDVLAEEEATLGSRPLYAEWLGPYYGFGGYPLYAVTTDTFRYVRGANDDLIPIAAGASESGTAGAIARLREALDRLVGTGPPAAPERIAPADEERFALLGHLAPPSLSRANTSPLSPADQADLVIRHRGAALLIGQKKYSAGIRALQAIVNEHPELTVVQYQLGAALMRSGRVDEAIAVFHAAREHQPTEPDLSLALAEALLRAGRAEEAASEADEAIALARSGDAARRASAHELAARVALARNDAEGATEHAKLAQAADPTLPIPQFVRGRLLYNEGKYEEAADAFQEAAAAIKGQRQIIPELFLYLGESLAHLERYSEAEAQYREELRAFPRSVHVYSRLAMLYAATDRGEAEEDVLNELVAASPTPESYAAAARLWTIVGDRSRAEALRSDARDRFRGDPSLALLGKDGRR